MKNPKLTKQRIALAFAVAVIADSIQFPITAATMTGVFTAPAVFGDFVVDCIVMAVVSALLGFHWLFLPSAVFEAVPGFDLCPTWTGCVAFVIWRRKKEQSTPPIVDVVEVQPLLLPAPAAEEFRSPEKLLADVQGHTPNN